MLNYEHGKNIMLMLAEHQILELISWALEIP